LHIYDFWVIYISSSFAWRCSRKILLPFFKSNVGRQHLDVGVGTGYFPARAADTIETLTLVDLQPNCLSMASRRIPQLKNGINTILADALQPGILPSSLPPSLKSYDSISLMYLIHALPGPPGHKLQIFRYTKPYLKEKGVVFGVTVLGKDVYHNPFAISLMWLFNRLGIFDNFADGKDEILNALTSEFEEVEVEVL
ncbi:S-adenosyl-L-methionine-dependent methyltransferase, partial [Elaphomyces granulatus]